jgi:hypothetical protein
VNLRYMTGDKLAGSQLPQKSRFRGPDVASKSVRDRNATSVYTNTTDGVAEWILN